MHDSSIDNILEYGSAGWIFSNRQIRLQEQQDNNNKQFPIIALTAKIQKGIHDECPAE